MVKYEYLPLSASDRNAEGSDQIHYPLASLGPILAKTPRPSSPGN